MLPLAGIIWDGLVCTYRTSEPLSGVNVTGGAENYCCCHRRYCTGLPVTCHEDTAVRVVLYFGRSRVVNLTHRPLYSRDKDQAQTGGSQRKFERVWSRDNSLLHRKPCSPYRVAPMTAAVTTGS